MAKASSKKLSAALTALASHSDRMVGPEGRELLTEALASTHAPVTIQAARLIAERRLDGFEAVLCSAYQGFAGQRAAASDPGAQAKEAILAALDAVESGDAALFGAAATYVQTERSHGRAAERDSAGGVRARGVLGLARLGHPDFLPLLGIALADVDPRVRVAAARAVAHRGNRDGAGLLLLRLGVGDDTPEVLIECLRGLLSVAPDLGLRHARRALRHPDPEVQAQALHALGTAPSDASVDLLVQELDGRSLAAEREPVIEALGLSLRPKARETLLDLLVSERASDAQAALSALAIHKYDARLTAQVKERTSRSGALARRFRELFPEAREP